MPTEYIRSKGWDFKERGNELTITTCPICGDTKKHFYISKIDGKWHCKKCDAGGTLYQLKKQLGDIEEVIHPAAGRRQWKKPDPETILSCNRDLLADTDTLDYLDGRRITQESVKKFKLGVKTKDGEKWLVIPHSYQQEWANVKYRSLPPAERKFEREFGCRSVLWNHGAIDRNPTIIITEGELDALTLHQNGFENVVGTTVGAQSFDPEWVIALEKTKQIFICFDSDDAGQKGAVAVAKRLGYDRCKNVILPVKDANDYFLKHWKQDFDRLLASARQFGLDGVITCRDAVDILRCELEGGEEQRGIATRWENVNRIISGWKPGDLVIVTALPKTGKTTFMLDITRSLVLSWIPTLFFCLEMRPERLIRKFIQAQYQIENPTLKDVQNAKVLLEKVPLYFGHNFKFQKVDDVLDVIREAVRRYGLKFVVFDNLHMLCRGDSVNERLAQAVLGFKLLAEECEIPIAVIAQPRKRENGASEIMSAEDVKYSSAIHSDCDQMIILHRNRKASKSKDIKYGMASSEESMDPITLVRVEAHRYGPGGETLLYYSGNHSRFEQLERKDTMRLAGNGASK